ncbi:quinone oxidoreductase family protein [Streptomyces mangrovisoli]|uniref:Quinone oxidoreductase n=1 Tax=Streptomyces mangrovisoli TaxID=1428628 RepID=A0A1J4NPS6_9ACTN|nr:zinc-binding dehydrogenase [Streptomyces mangrovisoli]OIJ63269.1 quinone oxidoreductase [Streptomyces mangrovisoli]
MRAIGFTSNGGPEVLEVIDAPEPAPGPGQVLIRVAYAGVNFAEIQHRRGEFGEPDGHGGYDIPGLEVSGTVVALGPGAHGPAVGERVAAYLPAFGGYAELAVAEAEFVRTVGELPLAQAAGVPCVYPTAYGVLTDAGRLRAGETVLVHAAAGGVGSAAARIARALGAGLVLGTVRSPGKAEAAQTLGYDAVFARDGFTEAVLEHTAGRGADLVLDPVGGAVRRASLNVLAPFGRVVVYGDLARDPDWTADAWDLWKNNRAVVGYNIGDVARRSPASIGAHLASALSALASGALAHEPPAVVPPAGIAGLHRRFEAGATRGKSVLDIGELATA